MSMDITTEVLAAVRANLPQAVGEELQALLKDGKTAIEVANKQAQEIEQLKKALDATTKLGEEMARNAADTVAKYNALKAREKAFEASEHAAEINAVRLEMLGAMNTQALRIIETVFKNTTLRESVMSNVPVVREYGAGSGSGVELHPSNATRMTERE